MPGERRLPVTERSEEGGGEGRGTSPFHAGRGRGMGVIARVPACRDAISYGGQHFLHQAGRHIGRQAQAATALKGRITDPGSWSSAKQARDP